MALNVDNCPRCGKLFSRTFYDICPNCVKEIEEQYILCRDYLKKNRSVTLSELSEATGVPLKQILKFIKEGRISLADAPNITYPCESCGAPIREHHLCSNCRERLVKKVAKAQQDIGKTSRSEEADQPVVFEFKGRRRPSQ